MKKEVLNEVLYLYPVGRIDTMNAMQVEAEFFQDINSTPHKDVVVDFGEIDYVSSAGLRVILKLKKEIPTIRIVNVSNDVYDVFEMTGFTEMMDIEKAYRVVSVEGCDVIGRGANGEVYRLSPDTIIKVYLNPEALEDIKRERELARCAFVLGIPTAIPYDVVRVGNTYGSVFELLNAQSFAQILNKSPERFEEISKMFVDLLKTIHKTHCKSDDAPHIKETVVGWCEWLEKYLPAETYEKLHKMISAVPDSNTMIHGDYHVKNVMLQNGEALLIDMDTISQGDPIFEFGSIFNAFVGYQVLNQGDFNTFLGISFDIAHRLYDKTLELYFEGKDPEYIQGIKDKAELVGFTRIMRRTIKRIGFENPEGKALIDYAKQRIIELTNKLNDLSL